MCAGNVEFMNLARSNGMICLETRPKLHVSFIQETFHARFIQCLPRCEPNSNFQPPKLKFNPSISMDMQAFFKIDSAKPQTAAHAAAQQGIGDLRAHRCVHNDSPDPEPERRHGRHGWCISFALQSEWLPQRLLQQLRLADGAASPKRTLKKTCGEQWTACPIFIRPRTFACQVASQKSFCPPCFGFCSPCFGFILV